MHERGLQGSVHFRRPRGTGAAQSEQPCLRYLLVDCARPSGARVSCCTGCFRNLASSEHYREDSPVTGRLYTACSPGRTFSVLAADIEGCCLQARTQLSASVVCSPWPTLVVAPQMLWQNWTAMPAIVPASAQEPQHLQPVQHQRAAAMPGQVLGRGGGSASLCVPAANDRTTAAATQQTGSQHALADTEPDLPQPAAIGEMTLAPLHIFLGRQHNGTGPLAAASSAGGDAAASRAATAHRSSAGGSLSTGGKQRGSSGRQEAQNGAASFAGRSSASTLSFDGGTTSSAAPSASVSQQVPLFRLACGFCQYTKTTLIALRA